MIVEKPIITVFMPVYNAEKYLKEAMESILNQTFKNFELLIVNDGSTDNSVNIINSFNDSRIVLVNNEKNMGLPYSRNRGLDIARGKYIAIMDSDDISDLNRLDIQYNFMEKNPDIVVVAGEKEFISNEEYTTYGMKEKLYSYLFYRKPVQIQIDLMFHNILVNSSTMIRMDYLKKNNIRYNSKCIVMQDYEFWTQICGKKGKINIIRKPLVKYRTHDNNISSVTRNDRSEMRRQIQYYIQKEYMNCFGIKVDSELTDYIKRFGKEFEEQKEEISYEYLYELYQYYCRILCEVKKNNSIDYVQLKKYLRQKYFLFLFKGIKKDKSLILKITKMKLRNNHEHKNKFSV